MYLLFLDESGTPGEDLFALGGFAVRAEDWHLLRERWEDCLTTAGWPLDKELKWSGTDKEVPPAVADAAYECLPTLPIECFVTVLYPKLGGYEEFFGSDENTYSTALMFIAERYQRFLDHNDAHGVIVLDSRMKEADDRLRRFFLRMQRDGTPFTDLTRIVDSLLFGPSHFSLGLQLADLVVGCTRAATFRFGDNTRWFRGLEPAFARHPSTGVIEGVGLKVFPESRREASKLFDPESQD